MTTTTNIRDTIQELAASHLPPIETIMGRMGPKPIPGMFSSAGRAGAMWQAAVDEMGREGLMAVLGVVYNMAAIESDEDAYAWLADLVQAGKNVPVNGEPEEVYFRLPTRAELGAWIDHHPDPLGALRRLAELKAEG